MVPNVRRLMCQHPENGNPKGFGLWSPRVVPTSYQGLGVHPAMARVGPSRTLSAQQIVHFGTVRPDDGKQDPENATRVLQALYPWLNTCIFAKESQEKLIRARRD